MHSSYSNQVQPQHPLVVTEQTASTFISGHLFRAQLLNIGRTAEKMEGVSVCVGEVGRNVGKGGWACFQG